MVSIICNTYNHEKYIKDALDGFIMQKTSFGFEVLIHDDASTDMTAKIIREYEKNHPQIIKPIFQTENQYSKSIPISLTFNYPRIKGKYIAICEGDDYWTDKYKLQKQFDAMELHPEIDMCAHAANVVDSDTKKIINKIAPSDSDTVFKPENVILGGGSFVSTNSLFFRKSLINTLPEFRKVLMLDYTLQIHGSLRGGMLYLKDNMSNYRSLSTNSWTRTMNLNPEKYYKHIEKEIKMLETLDLETNYMYTDTIYKKLKNVKIEFLYLKRFLHQKIRKDDFKIFYYAPLKWKSKILFASNKMLYTLLQKISSFIKTYKQ